MAVRYMGAKSDSTLDFIISLHQLRDTIRDERYKRLNRENGTSSRKTYHSGQEARLSQLYTQKK